MLNESTYNPSHYDNEIEKSHKLIKKYMEELVECEIGLDIYKKAKEEEKNFDNKEIKGEVNMATIEQIREEIEGFKVDIFGRIVVVEFENYFLEVKLYDMEGLEISKDTLVEVIFNKYENAYKGVGNNE